MSRKCLVGYDEYRNLALRNKEELLQSDTGLLLLPVRPLILFLLPPLYVAGILTTACQDVNWLL